MILIQFVSQHFSEQISNTVFAFNVKHLKNIIFVGIPNKSQLGMEMDCSHVDLRFLHPKIKLAFSSKTLGFKNVKLISIRSFLIQHNARMPSFAAITSKTFEKSKTDA